MSQPIGLVTGFEPFAGLPMSPSAMVVPHLDREVVEGCRLRALAVPVSHAKLPTLLPALVAEHRPAFVVGLGLAMSAPVVRVERYAINAASFGVADNDGARQVGGVAIEKGGPDGRVATWPTEAIVAALLDAGIPARASYHAGTHLCNFALYTFLGALDSAGSSAPCGFLHLPYLPEHIVWMMRSRAGIAETAPTAPTDLPSMSFEMQLAAVRTAIAVTARHAMTTEKALP